MTENYDDPARCKGILYMYVEFSMSYNNSYIGVNLTPYSGVTFWGTYFNSKKEFKELFFRSKNHPRY